MVKSDNQRIGPLVIHSFNIWVIKQSLSKDLFENLGFHVVLENALEHFVLVVLLVLALLAVNEI